MLIRSPELVLDWVDCLNEYFLFVFTDDHSGVDLMFTFKRIIPSGHHGILSIQYRKSSRTHYDVLGLDKAATTDEIKKAYYEKSKKHHPDLKSGDPAKFREITAAFEVLGNPRIKKLYDRGMLFDQTATPATENDSVSTDVPLESNKELDQWAQDQYTSAFVRDKIRRQNRRQSENIKVHKSQSRGSEVALFLVLLLAIGIGIVGQAKKVEEKNAKR